MGRQFHLARPGFLRYNPADVDRELVPKESPRVRAPVEDQIARCAVAGPQCSALDCAAGSFVHASFYHVQDKTGAVPVPEPTAERVRFWQSTGASFVEEVGGGNAAQDCPKAP